MIDAARLQVTVDADTSKAERDLSSFGDGIGSFVAGGVKIAAAALAGLTVVGAGAAFKIGQAFDSASDTIRIGTGATGELLKGLEQDFNSVVSSVPTSFGNAATAVADLNTRLGITGEPLREMSEQFINLSRVAGTDLAESIAQGTRVFGDWGIATDMQAQSLDQLFKVSQTTGIGVDRLMQQVVQFGAPLRAMGFSFEEATALMGKWEKEGVNSELVLGSMRIAMGKFADAGIPMREGLDGIIQSIQDLGPGAEATALAMDTFGARAGPDMAAAILEGRFSIDELMATLANSSETINDAAQDTFDFAESWQLFRNQVMVALAPVSKAIFQLAGTILQRLGPAILDVMPKAIDLFTRLANAVKGPLQTAFTLARDSILTFVDAIQGNWTDDSAIHPLHRAIGLIATIIHDQVIPAAMGFWSFLTDTLIPGVQTVFGGLMSVIQSALAGDWSAVGQTILNGISGALSALGGAAWDAAGWLIGLFTAIDWAGVAGTILGGLGAALNATGSAVWNAGAWLVGLFASIDYATLGSTIINGIVAGATAVSDFGQRIASQLQTQFASVDWSGIAQTIQGGISGAMQSVQDTSWFGNLAEQVQPVLDALQPLLDRILPSLQSAFNDLKVAFSGVTDAFAGMDIAPVLEALETLGKVAGTILVVALIIIVEAIEQFAEILSIVLPASAEVAVGAIEYIAGVINAIAAVVSGTVAIVSSLLQGDWSGAWQAARTMVDEFYSAVGTILSGLPAVIGGWILQAAQAGLEALGQFVTDSAARAAEIIPAIMGAILSLPEQVRGLFVQVATAALSELANLISQMPGKGVEILTGLVNGILSVIPQIPGIMAGIRSTIVGAFADALTWLVSAGVQILTGLWNGMSSMRDWVISQATGLAGSIKDGVVGAFKGVFGMESPSRVMADEIGAFLLPGITSGMQRTLGPTEDKIRNMARDLSGETLDAFNLYFAAIVQDGDFLNDWLTHLPEDIRDKVRKLGEEFAEGLDEAAQITQDAWLDFFARTDDIISGDAVDRVTTQLADLQRRLSLAEMAGAPQDVLDAMRATITALESELSLLTNLVNTDLVQAWRADEEAMRLAEEQAERLREAQDRLNASTVAAIEGIAAGGAAAGSFIDRMREDVDAARDAFDLGRLLGVSPEQLAILGEDLSSAEQLLNEGTRALQTALLSGLVDESTLQALSAAGGEWFETLYDSLFGVGALAQLEDGWNDITDVSLDQLALLISEMEDGGAEIIDTLVEQIAAGAISYEDALSLLSDATGEEVNAILEELQRLYDSLLIDLANALVTGSDPSAIEANMAVIEALMKSLADRAVATAETVIKAGKSMGVYGDDLRNSLSDIDASLTPVGSPSSGSGSRRGGPLVNGMNNRGLDSLDRNGDGVISDAEFMKAYGFVPTRSNWGLPDLPPPTPLLPQPALSRNDDRSRSDGRGGFSRDFEDRLIDGVRRGAREGTSSGFSGWQPTLGGRR